MLRIGDTARRYRSGGSKLGIVAAVLAPLLLGAASVVPTTVVGTNQQLGQVLSYQYQAVLRLGVNQIGDAPGQWFISLKDASGASLPCPIAGGDVGTQVPTYDNGCLVAIPVMGPRDVREWGVDMTGATDSTATLQAALNTGASVFVPAGTLQLSQVAFSANGQEIVCAGRRVTTLAQNSTTAGYAIEMFGRENAIKDCYFQPSVRGSGEQIYVHTPCYRCKLQDLELAYGYNGVLVDAGGTIIRGMTIGSSLGTYGILYQGTSAAARASGLWLYQVLINNAYPVNSGNGNEVVTWAPGANYVAGNITRVNGNIYQQSAASCTSAASGSGPSGLPAGSSPLNVFSGTIADGTCLWKFESASMIGYINDSWGDSSIIEDLIVLNVYQCILQRDTNNPGTLSMPNYPYYRRPQCDHNFATAIDLEAGFDSEIESPYAGSDFTGGGINFAGTYSAIGKVTGGRVADNWTSGIALNAGTEFTVDGVSVGSNSQAGSGLNSNIAVGPGVSQFSITNNKPGKDPQAANAWAQYGVNIAAGASDWYVVTGNICGPSGTVSGTCVNDGGTGTHKTVPANWNW